MGLCTYIWNSWFTFSVNYLLSSLPIKSNTNQKESLKEKQKKKISDNFSSPLDSGGKFIIHYVYGDLTESILVGS